MPATQVFFKTVPNEPDSLKGDKFGPVSKRQSSFGMRCVQCGDELLASEWSEYRNERQVHHVWSCWKCDCCFETFANIKTRDDIFPSLLVA
jgi:hypothetical protein